MLAGHSYEVEKSWTNKQGHRCEIHRDLDDIYGLDIVQGDTVICSVAFSVAPGASPSTAIEYQRALALCTFGAAVQGLLSEAK